MVNKKVVYTGPKGGKYHMKGGKKVYLNGGRAIRSGTQGCVFSGLNYTNTNGTIINGENKVLKLPLTNRISFSTEFEIGARIMTIPNWEQFFRPLEKEISVSSSNLELTIDNRKICKKLNKFTNTRKGALMTIGGPSLHSFLYNYKALIDESILRKILLKMVTACSLLITHQHMCLQDFHGGNTILSMTSEDVYEIFLIDFDKQYVLSSWSDFRRLKISFGKGLLIFVGWAPEFNNLIALPTDKIIINDNDNAILKVNSGTNFLSGEYNWDVFINKVMVYQIAFCLFKNFDFYSKSNPEFIKIINSMFQINPVNRPTLEELIIILDPSDTKDYEFRIEGIRNEMNFKSKNIEIKKAKLNAIAKRRNEQISQNPTNNTVNDLRPNNNNRPPPYPGPRERENNNRPSPRPHNN